jgi:adenylylsulfate kinase
MTTKILIMGLPGSGKTALAKELKMRLAVTGNTVDWHNADIVREQSNDWDFSHEGRIRQSERMRSLAHASQADFVICDFVAPLQETRKRFGADFIVWMHTIEVSRYDDTNKIFEAPTKYNVCVDTMDAVVWANKIVEQLTAPKQTTTRSW